jgi:hypothetical protein
MRALFLSLLFLSACAHHKFDDVLPGEGGVNTVAVKDPDETEARREAVRQALAFCDDEKRKAAITETTSKYYGEVSEENYKRMRRAGKVIEEISGGAIQKGDKAASDYAGAGYEVKMLFKCEAR